MKHINIEQLSNGELTQHHNEVCAGTDAWSCDCSRHPERPEERRNRSGRNRKSDSRANVYGRCGSTTAGRTGA